MFPSRSPESNIINRKEKEDEGEKIQIGKNSSGAQHIA